MAPSTSSTTALPSSPPVGSPTPSTTPPNPAPRRSWALAEQDPEPPPGTRAVEIARGFGAQLRVPPRHVFYCWPYKPRVAIDVEDLADAVRASLPERSMSPEALVPFEFYGPPAQRSLSGLGWRAEFDSILTVGVDLSVVASLRLWESMPREFVWGPDGIGVGSMVTILAEHLSLVHRLTARATQPITPMHFTYWLDGVEGRRFVYDGSAGQQLSTLYASPALRERSLGIGGHFEPANLALEAPELIRKIVDRIGFLAGASRIHPGFVDGRLASALERVAISSSSQNASADHAR